MLVTDQSDKSNLIGSAVISGGLTAICVAIAIASQNLIWLAGLPVAGLLFWFLRRRTQHRKKIMAMPFPDGWRSHLMSHVEFYRALDPDQRHRFEKMTQVFLSEIQITGIRTDVDELTRVLVGASAVIPVFGFDDWEYARLGEVLIYPGRFDEQYQTDANGDARTLGMVGVNHLSGIMILSNPDLINGFVNSTDKRNVGIHEFAHLVDRADGAIDGLPVGVPPEVVGQWMDWVGHELESREQTDHIDDYAYTNRAEYLAVLTEYFFESPELLKQKSPVIYEMLQKMYRQNTRSLLGSIVPNRRRRVGRNAPCPCGSGEKYKRCCLRLSRR